MLEAIGVMKGDAGTGNFRPDDKVSRNEMAVVMARLILGNYAADSYVGTHPFTDVPSWADRYVAACYSSGIINGTSATTYSGTKNVTAVQAAAMMLRALGYEDLSKSGQKWDVPVAAKANEINLFEGLTGSGTAQLTRNEIASLSLNALKADVVTTKKGQDISIPGTIEIIGERTYERVVRGSANGESDNYAGAAAGNDGVGYQQLCEKLYGKDLKLNNGGQDDFGRPARRWTYKATEVGKYAEDADASYTSEVKAKDLYSDLGLDKTTTATVTVDGKSAANFSIVKSGNTALPASGDGVLVEAYKKDNGGVDIVVMNVYCGKITKVTAAKDNDDRYVTVGGKNFDTEGFAKDDVVVYTVANDEIKTMALAEIVDGVTVTRRSGTSNFTAGGNTYKYNKVQKDTVETDVKVGSILDLYLDANGFVVKVDVSKSTSDYAYVLDVGSEGRYTEQTYWAKLLLTDGTEVEAKLDKDNCKPQATDTPIDLSNSTNRNSLKKQIVEYTKDSKDVYSLTVKNDTGLTGSAKVSIENGKAGMILGGTTSSTHYADSKTVFLVKTGDNWATYTGYNAVPTLKEDSAGKWTADVTSGLAKVVVIEDVSSESDDVVYVLSSKAGKLVKEDGQDDYYEYTAVVNGEITTVKGKPNGGVAPLSGVDKLYKSIIYSNAEQEVIDFGAGKSKEYGTSVDDNYKVHNTVTKVFENGTVGINSVNYAVADDVQVFAVTSGDKIETGDMDDLVATSISPAVTGTTVDAIVKDGKIVTLFYQVTPVAPGSSFGTGGYNAGIGGENIQKAVATNNTQGQMAQNLNGYSDGLIIFKGSDTAKIKAAIGADLSAHTDVSDIIFVKYHSTIASASAGATFTVRDKDGTPVYQETLADTNISAAGEVHYFYIQVTKNASDYFANSAGVAVELNAPLPKGTYTWTVNDGTENFLTGSFTIG